MCRRPAPPVPLQVVADLCAIVEAHQQRLEQVRRCIVIVNRKLLSLLRIGSCNVQQRLEQVRGLTSKLM